MRGAGQACHLWAWISCPPHHRRAPLFPTNPAVLASRNSKGRNCYENVTSSLAVVVRVVP